MGFPKYIVTPPFASVDFDLALRGTGACSTESSVPVLVFELGGVHFYVFGASFCSTF